MGSPGQHRKRRRQQRPEASPASGSTDSSAAEPVQAVVEEHVLIQQWGFDVLVRVVPLGWRELVSTAAPAKQKTSTDSPEMYSNPLYTSEDTSASSMSDDAGALPPLHHVWLETSVLTCRAPIMVISGLLAISSPMHDKDLVNMPSGFPPEAPR